MTRPVRSRIAAVLSLGLVAAGLTMTNAAVAVEETPAPAVEATVAYSRVADPVLRGTPSWAIGSRNEAAVGSLIQMADGTPRQLSEVSFVLANWACQEGYGDAPAGCFTTDPEATFDVDVTVTVHAVDRTGETPQVGAVLATRSVTTAVPYRPSQEPELCTQYPTDHFDEVLGECRPDVKHLVTVDGFDGVALPDEAIVSIGYATLPGTPAAVLNVGVDALDTEALVGTETHTVTWPESGAAVVFRASANRPQLAVGTTTSFTDVPLDHAFFEQIEWLTKEGIATGYTDGTFRPAAPVSRQAAAAFLSRWLPTPELADCTVAPFTDVPATHTFCKQIAWMSDAALTAGYPDGTFRPAATVTRQAGAAFIARAVGGELPVCTVAPFTDVPVDHAFCEEIQWMKAEGLSVGYPDGTFGATLPMTRQAMAAWIYAAPAIPVVE